MRWRKWANMFCLCSPFAAGSQVAAVVQQRGPLSRACIACSSPSARFLSPQQPRCGPGVVQPGRQPGNGGPGAPQAGGLCGPAPQARAHLWLLLGLLAGGQVGGGLGGELGLLASCCWWPGGAGPGIALRGSTCIMLQALLGQVLVLALCPILSCSGGVERSVLLWQPKGNVNRKVRCTVVCYRLWTQSAAAARFGRSLCSVCAAVQRVCTLNNDVHAHTAAMRLQVGELAGHSAGVSQLVVADEQSQVGGSACLEGRQADCNTCGVPASCFEERGWSAQIAVPLVALPQNSQLAFQMSQKLSHLWLPSLPPGHHAERRPRGAGVGPAQPQMCAGAGPAG